MTFYKRVYASSAGPPAKRTRYAAKQSITAQLTQLKRKISRFKPEVKNQPINIVISNVGTGVGSISLLSGIAQGVDYNNRLGSKIHPVHLDINVSLTSGYSTNPNDLYGCYLVKDNMSAGALPVIAATKDAIMQGFAPETAQVQPLTLDRFTIMREWLINGASMTQGNQPSLVRWRVPLSGLTEFTDTTNAVTGAQRNAYYIVVLTDDTAGTVDFAVDGYFRFSDA